jgi:8-amino-7-oxononanoate synthase
MSKAAPVSRATLSRGSSIFDKCYRYEEPARVRAAGIYTFFRTIGSAQDPEVTIDGRRFVMLGSNNYLGLTNDPRVKEAAIEAIRRYGSGCAGSRFLNGTLDLHVRLEERLAEFMRMDAAITFSTGFQVNLGVISCLVGKGDSAFLDKQDHACIIDGARLCFGEVRKFRHNDVSDLRRQMRNDAAAKGRFIVVDGVFSMEGDIAPLREITDLCERYGARLMVDEAHAVGVLGARGAGTAELLGVEGRVDLRMGTFSKSLASCGGFIAGDAEVIEFLKVQSRAFLFTASGVPAAVGAALAALRVIRSPEGPELMGRVLANARRLNRGLHHLGFDVVEPSPVTNADSSQELIITPIVPVRVGEDWKAGLLWRALWDAGVFTNVAVHPAVPPDGALLRTSVMATHDDAVLDRALEVFATVKRDFEAQHGPLPGPSR